MTKDEKALFGINKLNVKKSEIPAVTHVDYSARIQTVHKEINSNTINYYLNLKRKLGVQY
jgi:carbamoyltransferase